MMSERLANGLLVQYFGGKDVKDSNPSGEYPVYGSGGSFGSTDSYLYEGEGVLFGRKGTLDKPQYVNGKFWLIDTAYFAKPDPSKLCPRFFYYWATTLPFDLFMTNTARPSTTSADLARQKIPFLPLETQHRIADYLDRETAKIDQLTHALDEYVQLLELRKNIYITEQLKPQADESLISIIHCAEVNPLTPEFKSIGDSTDVSFMPLENIWANGLADYSLTKTWKKSETSYTQFRRGDILVPKVTPTVFHGRSMIADIPTDVGLASSEVHVLRCKSGIDPIWMTYNLLTAKFLDNAKGNVYGVGGLQRISPQYLQNYKVAQIPLEKQRKISERLEQKTSETSNFIHECQELRNLLLLRRQILITDVVTGKKEV